MVARMVEMKVEGEGEGERVNVGRRGEGKGRSGLKVIKGRRARHVSCQNRVGDRRSKV